MTLYRASPPKLPAPPASGRTSPIPRPFDLERESRVTYARCSFSTSLLSFIADGRHARRLAVLQKAITRRRRRRSRLRCDPAIRGFPPARPACASGRDSLTANTLLAHAPVVNPARLDHQPAVPERTVCQSGARRDDRRRSQGRAKHGRGVCPARCAEPARVSEPPEPEPDGLLIGVTDPGRRSSGFGAPFPPSCWSGCRRRLDTGGSRSPICANASSRHQRLRHTSAPVADDHAVETNQ